MEYVRTPEFVISLIVVILSVVFCLSALYYQRQVKNVIASFKEGRWYTYRDCLAVVNADFVVRHTLALACRNKVLEARELPNLDGNALRKIRKLGVSYDAIHHFQFRLLKPTHATAAVRA